MIMVIHKKKLILSLVVIVSLALLAYVDLRQRTTTFFKTAKTDGIKTIVLDPGHGGEDPGAVSDYSETKEKDVNLEVALKLKTILEKDGYRVIMTRKEDVLKFEPGTTNIVQKRRQDLETRKKLIDESGADIAVSIHLNKFPQTQYSGAQVFYPPDFPESKRLAESLQLKIREIVDPNNKREALVKKETIILLKEPKVVTAMVECGFLSNQDEERLLVTKAYQEKIIQGIREGIQYYFSQEKDKENERQLESAYQAKIP
jgi:N-acetylmuramoyl-L-alanine amidase